ncbi:MAG: hypothetical protein ACRDVN_11780 [Jiangellaceae bacterium]
MAMTPAGSFRRERLIAPQVRSARAAARLLVQMRQLGSDRVLPIAAWRTATQLAAEPQ